MKEVILDKKVMPGMVFTGGSGGSGLYVVKRVGEDKITCMEIGEKRNLLPFQRIHWCGNGC